MSRRAITTYLAAAALIFSAVPVLAQDPPAGARPNSGGGSSGSAVARPSGGGGEGGGATSSSAGARGPSSGGAANASSGADSSERAVPRGARPRDDRPTVGSALERGSVPSREYQSPYTRYTYYYRNYPYGYYWPGYGYGLGYFYDPWLWGSPYGYGFYDPYAYGGGGYNYSRGRSADLGSVRLRVKPADAQVYVDGYFMGEIDSFDGVFQRLTLEAGAHRIEIRADGYEPVQFEVMIVPGETITYKGDLKRIQ